MFQPAQNPVDTLSLREIRKPTAHQNTVTANCTFNKHLGITRHQKTNRCWSTCTTKFKTNVNDLDFQTGKYELGFIEPDVRSIHPNSTTFIEKQPEVTRHCSILWITFQFVKNRSGLRSTGFHPRRNTITLMMNSPPSSASLMLDLNPKPTRMLSAVMVLAALGTLAERFSD